MGSEVRLVERTLGPGRGVLRDLGFLHGAELLLEGRDEAGRDIERQGNPSDDGRAHSLSDLRALDITFRQRPNVAEGQRQVERRVRDGAEICVLAPALWLFGND